MENGGCPEGPGAEEYALGFRDGFVDYVYAGGAGQPPPVPPRKFWNVAWRTPAGAAGAEQWFAGYRHGAQSARNGGYRENGVVHSSYLGSDSPWVEGEPTSASPEDVGAPTELLPAPAETTEYDQLLLPEPLTPSTNEEADLLDEASDDVPANVQPAGDPPGEPALRGPLPADIDEAPAPETPAPGGEFESSNLPRRAPSASQRFRRALSVARSHETSDPQ